MYSLVSGFLTAMKMSCICQLPCAGSHSHCCWGNFCYLLCTFCCLLNYDCYCCLANLGCHCCFWNAAKGSFLELLISAFSFTLSVLEHKTHRIMDLIIAYHVSTIPQVVTYVVTRPGRELLFTVVTQDEKYKAKVFQFDMFDVDVFVSCTFIQFSWSIKIHRYA